MFNIQYSIFNYQLTVHRKLSIETLFLLMQVDYLIIGQGLCGTWLSWYLTKENRTFIVIDKNEAITPSKVSDGIINPVTGRRLVKVWMAEQLLSFIHDAYSEMGS